MPSYPNRCQHIKVNGTQCGSPALRRNRFCYFHKRYHDEQVALHLDQVTNDRAKTDQRRRRIMIDLPVLEDANSIQVSLMQIMRLLITGELNGKTAGLLLYALQTASSNLQRTRFEPDMHDVILDPRAVNQTPLDMPVWEDEEFEEEEEEYVEDSDDDDEEEDEEEKKPEPPAKRPMARMGDCCVITADGRKLFEGFPTAVLERTIAQLNGKSG